MKGLIGSLLAALLAASLVSTPVAASEAEDADASTDQTTTQAAASAETTEVTAGEAETKSDQTPRRKRKKPRSSANVSKPKPEPAQPKGLCTDSADQAHDLELTVEGEPATGRFSLPHTAPKGLVVFAHGYGHTSYSWIQHMKRVSRELGVIAVAMDYRGMDIKPDANGDGYPEARGWPAMNGAEDTIAAAQFFETKCRKIETIALMGVSMGANMSGLAVALQPERSNGQPLWDYWLDIEGATNVTETYNEARALAQATGNDFAERAVEDIEVEMGGTFEQKPDAYRERTVVARSADVAGAGLDGIILVHGLDDGLVPYNQSREMVAGLLANGFIDTEMYTVGRRSAQSEKETTATGYVGDQLFAQIDETYISPFAGHASEKSETHVVMTTAFEKLYDVMKGKGPDFYREYFVDGELGVFPSI